MRFLKAYLVATSLLYGASSAFDEVLVDPAVEVNGQASVLTQKQKSESLVDEILGTGIATASNVSEQDDFVELSDLPFVKMPKDWQARGDVFNNPVTLLLLLEKLKVRGKIPAVNRTKLPVNLVLTKKIPDQYGLKSSGLSIAAGTYKNLEFVSVDSIESLTVDCGYLNVVSEQGMGVLTIETEQPLLFPKPLAAFNFAPDLVAIEKRSMEVPEEHARKIKEYMGHVRYLRHTIAQDEWFRGKKAAFKKDSLYLPLYRQRQYIYDQIKIEKLLNEPLPDTPRIPQNLFSVWLTTQDELVEPEDEYLDFILRNAAINSAKDGWKQYLVVQDFVLQNPELFKRTRKKLEGSSVQLTSYERLIGTLELQEAFDTIVGKSKFAMASDLLRVELLYKLGGAFLDIDLLTLHSLKPLFYLYDSLFGVEPMSEFIGNAFMAASAGHPIMLEMLRLMARNFKLKAEGKTDFYSASIVDESDPFNTILQTGPCVTTVAFFNKAGVGGRRDFIAPPEMFFPAKSLLRPEFKIPKINDSVSLGAATLHLWRTTWAKYKG